MARALAGAPDCELTVAGPCASGYAVGFARTDPYVRSAAPPTEDDRVLALRPAAGAATRSEIGPSIARPYG